MPELVVFRVRQRRQALLLAAVDRVLRAVAITPVPGAPSLVLGAIDVAGTLVPVYSVRRRLGLPDRPPTPEDHFLLAHGAHRTVALAVDEVEGVQHGEPPVFDDRPPPPGLQPLAALARLDDELVLVHDLDAYLAPFDELRLDDALQAVAGDEEPT